jgi:predicted HD phosphohydrolase
MSEPPRTVSFTSMDDATDQEIALIMGQAGVVLQGKLLGNVLGLLNGLKGDQLGYQVDRYEHSLQTASRAYRDGARTDLIVAGVLHDIGEGIAPANHSEFAAAVLQPYLDEEASFVVRYHGLFQGYHYFHKMGQDRNARDKYRDSPYFDTTAHFCAAWDQRSFNPDYESLPLEVFMPMIEEVFGRPPSSGF